MNKKIKQLLNNGFTYIFVSSVFNKVIAFLCNSMIVHLLTKTEYGTYTYAYNLLSFALLLAGLGIPAALLQLLCENIQDKKKIKKLYQYGGTIACIFNLFLGAVMLFSAYVLPLKISEAKLYLAFLAFIPFFDTYLSLQLVYMRSLLMTKQYAIANSIHTILLTIFTVGGAYYGKVYGVILGRYLSYIFSAAVIWILFKLPSLFAIPCNLETEKKDLFKIALTSVANNGLSELMYLLDVFVMGITVASQEMIASYKVATQIPATLTFIPATVITYIYPYFAQNRKNKLWLRSNYWKLLVCMGMLNLSVIMPLMVGAPTIITIFYGSNYRDSILIFRILLINYLISGTFRIISGNLLVTQRQLKFNFYVALFSGLANTLGNFILIPIWGSMGAVITTVSTVLCTSIVSTYKLCHIIYGREEITC